MDNDDFEIIFLAERTLSLSLGEWWDALMARDDLDPHEVVGWWRIDPCGEYDPVGPFATLEEAREQ